MATFSRKDIFSFLALLSYLLSVFFYEQAKAWMSISMFVLLVLPFVVAGGKTSLQNFLNHQYFIALSICAAYLLCYYFNSTNHAYFWNRIVMRGPLLALPWVAAGMFGFLTASTYRLLLKVFVVLCVLGSFYSLYFYFTDYDLVTANYLKAQVMPTIINHVRFSVMIAMACFISYRLVVRSERLEKFVWTILFVYLIVFLHLFSVRSGLIALYGVVTIELFFNIRRLIGIKKVVFICFVMIGLLTAAIRLIPTLQNKWTNTIEDIQVYQNKGYANHNSLTTRFISYEAAIFIFKNQPLFGCGLGDIKDETDAYFKQKFPDVETPILPHNQFLFMLAATGLVGLVLFVLLFYSPLWFPAQRKNRILVAHYVILTLSFLTEPMLETQLGMGYSMLFIVLPLMMKEQEDI